MLKDTDRYKQTAQAHFTNGDYNLGVSLGPSGGEGVVSGNEVYDEVTYSPNDGLSAGYGMNDEAGAWVNVGPGIKGFNGGIYTTAYISKDSRKE